MAGTKVGLVWIFEQNASHKFRWTPITKFVDALPILRNSVGSTAAASFRQTFIDDRSGFLAKFDELLRRQDYDGLEALLNFDPVEGCPLFFADLLERTPRNNPKLVNFLSRIVSLCCENQPEDYLLFLDSIENNFDQFVRFRRFGNSISSQKNLAKYQQWVHEGKIASSTLISALLGSNLDLSEILSSPHGSGILPHLAAGLFVDYNLPAKAFAGVENRLFENLPAAGRFQFLDICNKEYAFEPSEQMLAQLSREEREKLEEKSTLRKLARQKDWGALGAAFDSKPVDNEIIDEMLSDWMPPRLLLERPNLIDSGRKNQLLNQWATADLLSYSEYVANEVAGQKPGVDDALVVRVKEIHDDDEAKRLWAGKIADSALRNSTLTTLHNATQTE